MIGRIVARALTDDYAVHGLDKQSGPDVEWVRDMARFRRVAPAFEGMTAIIDLAANASVSASWKSVRENNIPATVNAFEAARRAGVRRVIFASSNHVVGMYERDEPYASVVGRNLREPSIPSRCPASWPTRRFVRTGRTGLGKLSAKLPPGTTRTPTAFRSSVCASERSTPRIDP